MNTKSQAQTKIFYFMTFFIGFGLLLAAVINIFLLQQYKLGSIEAVFVVLLGFASYLVMTKRSFITSAWITSLVLGVIILIAILNGKGGRGSYSLIIVFPLVVYQILGRVSATYLYLVFSSAVIGLTVYGVYNWAFNIVYIFNTSIALFMGGFIAYYIEKTMNNAFDLIMHASNTDSLTGLWNRKRSDEIIKRLNSESQLQDSQYSIIMLDIDFFKNINDKHGHQMGDQVLVEFSRMIVKSFRKVDMTFRWGGEEFLVVLPNTNIAEAEKMVESFIQTTRKHNFVDLEDQITVSAGVAQYTSTLNNDELVKLADDALYESKNNGRDRYTLATMTS